jgi:hypothetical protein
VRSHDADLWEVYNIYFAEVTLVLTCKRCAKRNTPGQCVYHPAPLTKGPTSHDGCPNNGSSPRVNSFSTAYQSPSRREVGRDTIYPEAKRLKQMESLKFPPSVEILSRPSQPQVDQALEELRKPLSDSGTQADALGFDNSAGFINHSAVLAEHELSIGIQSSSDDITPVSKVSQLQIDRGAIVLTLFKDLSAIGKYTEK